MHDSCCYGCALCTSQFKDNLSVLAIERRLHSKLIRLVFFYKFIDSGIYICQFLKRVLYLSEIKNSHIDIMRALGIYTDNPETKNIGSGINSEYDLFFSQYNRIRYMDGEPQESRFFRPSDYFREGQPRL